MKCVVGGGVLELVEGDITRQEVDAIVNAANETLLGGGGVDGAIHRAGGPAILAECKTLGGCKTGDAKITTGGNLPAKHVIHTVGPVYRDGNSGEPALLESCHRRSLEVARENNLRTVAFPAISCGIYGYPIADAAKIALTTLHAEMAQAQTFDAVRIVLFGREILDQFSNVFENVLVTAQ
jgi:O-acetyl-ADP-ribose deacetylase